MSKATMAGGQQPKLKRKRSLAEASKVETVQPPALARPSLLLSVVIPVRNEGAYLQRTVAALQATLPAASEIIVVDNGSDDSCSKFLYKANDERLRLIRKPPLGVARARNVGARAAQGDSLVFADGHVDPSPGWWEALVVALEDEGVGAVAPVITVMEQTANKGYGIRFKNPALECEWLGKQSESPYPVPLLGGAFMAIKRTTFQATGGFDEGMAVYGSEDLEYSLRLWLFGYQQLVVPTVEVAHLFRHQHPYQVDWTVMIYNKLRLACGHFNSARLERLFDSEKAHAAFAPAMARLAASDIWQRRQQFAATRQYDDTWFFERFGNQV